MKLAKKSLPCVCVYVCVCYTDTLSMMDNWKKMTISGNVEVFVV